jgi:hypothetical protein
VKKKYIFRLHLTMLVRFSLACRSWLAIGFALAPDKSISAFARRSRSDFLAWFSSIFRRFWSSFWTFFKDSKTFVDLKLKFSRQEVESWLISGRCWSNLTNPNPGLADIRQFVEDNFTLENQMDDHIPPGSRNAIEATGQPPHRTSRVGAEPVLIFTFALGILFQYGLFRSFKVQRQL